MDRLEAPDRGSPAGAGPWGTARHAGLLPATRWGGFAGYDAWFARANNASFGVLAAYNELVPNFERLFEREGRDFERFYAEVKCLAALPPDQRRAQLP